MQLESLSSTQVPSGDKLDLGVDFSLLAPTSADSRQSLAVAVSSTQLSQEDSQVVIDPDKAAEDLVNKLQGLISKLTLGCFSFLKCFAFANVCSLLYSFGITVSIFICSVLSRLSDCLNLLREASISRL